MADNGDHFKLRDPPKFNGKNYLNWSFKMSNHAVVEGYQGFYDGTAGPRPAVAKDA